MSSATDSRVVQAHDEAHVARQRKRASIGSLIGTTIEWYEYYIYGATAALVFPQLFFPGENALVGTILSFSTFAVAFVSRPIGAAVFGHYGDRIGRKTTLIVTLVLTGLATFLVGVLPGYESIGIAAPLLLTLLRLVQGFGVGGEWGGAVLVSLEWGEQDKRGKSGSWPQMGTSVGLILSTLAVTLSSSLTGDDYESWGWRLPFLFSAVLVVVGLFVRLSLDETPSFAKNKAAGTLVSNPVGAVVKRYPKELVLIAFLRLSEQMPFYIFTSFILGYAVSEAGVSREFVLYSTLVAAVIDLCLLPTFARLADRIGRRKMYYIGCAVLIALAYPYFAMLQSGNHTLIFLAIATSLLPHAIQYGAQASIISEQFPANVRYAGAGIGYQLSSLVAGGPAPIIAAWLAATYSGYAVATYIAIGGVVAAIALRLMPDRQDNAL
jgi:metabolite-proton symporter